MRELLVGKPTQIRNDADVYLPRGREFVWSNLIRTRRSTRDRQAFLEPYTCSILSFLLALSYEIAQHSMLICRGLGPFTPSRPA